jgi:glutathione S-transferase
LEELGVDYEAVAVSIGEYLQGAHLRRHPLGRVPALELDDGQVLLESTAIVLALADRYPDAGLIGPLDPRLRGQIYEWSIMAMTELESTALGASNPTGSVQDEFRAAQLRGVRTGLDGRGRAVD